MVNGSKAGPLEISRKFSWVRQKNHSGFLTFLPDLPLGLFAALVPNCAQYRTNKNHNLNNFRDDNNFNDDYDDDYDYNYNYDRVRAFLRGWGREF